MQSESCAQRRKIISHRVKTSDRVEDVEANISLRDQQKLERKALESDKPQKDPLIPGNFLPASSEKFFCTLKALKATILSSVSLILLAEVTAMKEDAFCLFYDAKPIQDNDALSSYDIKHEATIHFTVQLQGGDTSSMMLECHFKIGFS